MEELYINGELVDISPSTKISLNFKNNLLGAIDKITASNSQTIRLPKTPKNRRIFGNAGAPAANSSERYTRLPARYIRDGVEVVSAAYAALLSSGDSYEVALYWGVMTSFSQWIDSELKIGDIVAENVKMAWSNNTPLSTSVEPALIVADYNNGIGSYGAMGAYANKVALHPFVSCAYLMGRISDTFGITFDYSATTESALKGMGLLCPTRKNKQVAIPATEIALNMYGNHFWTNWVGGVEFSANSSSFSVVGKKIRYNGINSYGVTSCVTPVTIGRYAVTVNLSIKVIAYEGVTPNVKIVLLKVDEKGNGSLISEIYGVLNGNIYSNPYYSSIPVDVGENESLAIAVVTYRTMVELLTTATSSPFITITPPQDDLDINYGQDLYASVNLPDISTVDFVKMLCSMLGLQAMPDLDNPKRIRLVSLEELDNKRVQALDWSARLVGSEDGEPISTTFQVDGYGRRNIFAYDSDEGVTENANGVLIVPDENLEPEVDVVTLKLSASNETQASGEVLAEIPLYSVELDKSENTELTFNSVKPRIVYFGYKNDNSTLKALGSPLYWPNLLSRNYGPLQNLLTNAVVIEEQVRLSAIDLKELDFTLPIYLRQYGRYYAVKDVQTNGVDDVCKVTLIQLGEGAVNTTVEELYLIDADSLYLEDSNGLQLTAEFHANN